MEKTKMKLPSVFSHHQFLGKFNLFCSAFFCLTIFFVTLMPIDFLFATTLGQGAKVAVGGGMMFVSFLLALANLFVQPSLFLKDKKVVFFCLFTPCYFLAMNIVSPPPLDYSQMSSLVILAPLGCLMGVYSSPRVVVRSLFVFAAIYEIIFCYGLCAGDISLHAKRFQGILSTDSYESVSSYQNATFFLSLFSILLLSLCDSSKKYATRIIGYLFFILTLIPVITMGGRGATLALGVATIATLVFRSHDRWAQKIIWGTVFGVTLGLGIYLLMPTLKGSLLVDRYAYLLQVGDGSSRGHLFTSAINLWTQDVQSFLFGIGSQQFPVAIGENDPGAYPHNFILELLCEYGVVGCLFFSIPFVWAFLVALKQKYSTPGVLGVLVMFLVVCLGSGGLRTIWQTVYIVFVFYQLRSAHALAKS